MMNDSQVEPTLVEESEATDVGGKKGSAVPRSIRRRLAQMNKAIYPCRLRYRTSVGTFQFSYRRNGREIWKTLGKDLEVAYERALVLAREVNSGIPLVSKRALSLETWYETWSGERYPKLARKTVFNYQYCWTRVPLEMRQLDIHSITRDWIEKCLSAIGTEGARDHVSRFLSILLNSAVKAGHLAKSPWSYTQRLKKKIIPVLSVEEMVRVCECASESVRPAIAIGLFCGLRLGEVMALKVQDVDLEHRVLYVRGGRTRMYGEAGVDELKSTKTGDPRPVPIPTLASRLIEPVRGEKKDEDLVFPAFRSDINKRLKHACKLAKVPKLTFHALRHVCATRLIMTGGMALAQAVLGHSEIGTTIDIYAHLDVLWMQKKMETAFIDPELKELKQQADALTRHNDPNVRVLAEKVSSVCVKLCQ